MNNVNLSDFALWYCVGHMMKIVDHLLSIKTQELKCWISHAARCLRKHAYITTVHPYMHPSIENMISMLSCLLPVICISYYFLGELVIRINV